MHRRSLRILLLLWVAWWFGVAVPGHERGQITVDGKSSAPRGCCAEPENGAAKTPVRHPSPAKSESRCAVCAVVATLDAPASAGADLTPLELLRRVAPVRLPVPISLAIRLSYHGRAPPTLGC